MATYRRMSRLPLRSGFMLLASLIMLTAYGSSGQALSVQQTVLRDSAAAGAAPSTCDVSVKHASLHLSRAVDLDKSSVVAGLGKTVWERNFPGY